MGTLDNSLPLGNIWRTAMLRHANTGRNFSGDDFNACNEVLHTKLSKIEPLYETLGNPGIRFREAFKRTGCTEEPNSRLNVLAAYIPYEATGFANVIVYGPKIDFHSPTIDKDILETGTHEKAHVLSFAGSAACHASIYNMQSKYVLCLEDAILLEEWKERVGFAVSAGFERLRESAEGRDKPGVNPMSEENLDDFMQEKASINLETMITVSGQSMLSYYRDKVIGDYFRMWKYRKDEDLVFVRLDDKDRKHLRYLAGMDVLGETDNPKKVPFTDMQKARIAVVSRKYDYDRKDCQTLAEALKWDGTNRPEFLAKHRKVSREDISSVPAMRIPPVFINPPRLQAERVFV